MPVDKNNSIQTGPNQGLYQQINNLTEHETKIKISSIFEIN